MTEDFEAYDPMEGTGHIPGGSEFDVDEAWNELKPALLQHHQREKRKRRKTIIAYSSFVLLGLFVLTFWRAPSRLENNFRDMAGQKINTPGKTRPGAKEPLLTGQPDTPAGRGADSSAKSPAVKPGNTLAVKAAAKEPVINRNPVKRDQQGNSVRPVTDTAGKPPASPSNDRMAIRPATLPDSSTTALNNSGNRPAKMRLKHLNTEWEDNSPRLAPPGPNHIRLDFGATAGLRPAAKTENF